MSKATLIRDGHKLYAICTRHTAYYIVGPFDSWDALDLWGLYEEKNGDDPRWQSVELPDGVTMPTEHPADWHPGYTP